MILHELFRVVSRFPRYMSCNMAESRLPLESVLINRQKGIAIFFLIYPIVKKRISRSQPQRRHEIFGDISKVGCFMLRSKCTGEDFLKCFL